MRQSRRLGLLLATCSLAAAGCGDGNAGSDPASFAPANTPLYVEAVVRPEGAQREELRSLVGRFLPEGADVDAEVRKVVAGLLEDVEEGLSYERDFEPWLGERAAFFLTAVNSEESADGVLALQSRDDDAAQEAVARNARRENARQASYEGVDYWIHEDGSTSGVFESTFVLASTDAEFKRAVDSSEGSSLADSEAFEKAREPLPDERVGLLYVDVRRLFSELSKSGGAGSAELQLLGQVFGSSLPPMAMALVADEDTAALEWEAELPQSGRGGINGLFGLGESDIVGQLPGDSWGAAGIPDLGQTARGLFTSLGGAFGGPVIEAQLERELGINLQRDVFGWMGDAGFFVRGTEFPATGALVVEVTDAAAARAAVPKLVDLATTQLGVEFRPAQVAGAESSWYAAERAFPQPIFVGLTGERFTIALGEETAALALAADEKLEDSELWSRAEAQLGDLEPTFVLDGQAIVRVIGQLLPAEDFARARPYLEGLDVVAGGSERDGDRARSRFAIGAR